MKRLVFALALAAAGCGSRAPVHVEPVPAPPSPFAVESIEPLGRLTTNALAHGRDAGFSVGLGDEVLWLFGDTFPTTEIMLTATAARSSTDEPMTLREPVSIDGVPYALYEESPRERAYNRSHADPPACCFESDQCPLDDRYCRCDAATDCGARIAVWPGAAIALGDGTAVSFFEKVKVGAAPWDFDVLGTGVARIDPGSVRARRYLGPDREPVLVFSGDEPKFLHAAVAGDGLVYAYGERGAGTCATDTYVARVRPTVMYDRTQYEFWDGGGWTARLEEAQPVLPDTGGGLGSVMALPGRPGFLAASAGLCTEGASMFLRFAETPVGPWSAPVMIDLAPLGADAHAYAGVLHASLSSTDRIVASFYQPLVRGEDVLGAVELFALRLSFKSIDSQ